MIYKEFLCIYNVTHLTLPVKISKRSFAYVSIPPSLTLFRPERCQGVIFAKSAYKIFDIVIFRDTAARAYTLGEFGVSR